MSGTAGFIPGRDINTVGQEGVFTPMMSMFYARFSLPPPLGSINDDLFGFECLGLKSGSGLTRSLRVVDVLPSVNCRKYVTPVSGD